MNLREAAEVALKHLGSVSDWDTTYPIGKAKEALHQALAQPKRDSSSWVGLTADEIWKCNKAETGSAVEFHICSAHQNVLDFAEAIEAKLKEKNSCG